LIELLGFRMSFSDGHEHRPRIGRLSHGFGFGIIYPVAEELLARNIPFVLASGYGDWALPKSL
jgi:hypothetical protein